MLKINNKNRMNSIKRVLKAFKKLSGKPDRVPIQFDLCRQLSDHFGNELEVPANYTKILYEDVTCRISAKTKVDILNYIFPAVDALGRFGDAEALVKKYHDEYLIFGDIKGTVFSLAHQLVGIEKLLVDKMMETEYVIPLFLACADFQTEIGLRLVEKGVEAIWFGDDFGIQQSLIMDPETFRTQLKSIYAQMIQLFKAAKADIIPILHYDGAVTSLLKDIHEMNFEVFNPVQPGVSGYIPKDMKSRLGDKFSFWSAIDQQDLLPNETDEELEDNIVEKKNSRKNDGYMVSPATLFIMIFRLNVWKNSSNFA